MPTYEYACPTCGIVEAFQSIKENALTKCPRCKKHKVTRMVSRGGGIIFKGSGFWETDYNRSQEYASKAKSDAGAAPTTSPSEAPPASKPQTEAKPQKAEVAAKPASQPTAKPSTSAETPSSPSKTSPSTKGGKT